MTSPNPVARTQQETADHLGDLYSTISRGYACMRLGSGKEGMHDSKTPATVKRRLKRLVGLPLSFCRPVSYP
jgi:hypothetical protein